MNNNYEVLPKLNKHFNTSTHTSDGRRFQKSKVNNNNMDPNSPTIPEYFSGKSIFITGASGFMGKVLVEKLLRSCPDLKKVYLLMRAKRGVDSQLRLRKLLDIPLFDRLRDERGDTFETQIHIIDGDVKKLGLGISSEDEQLLLDETCFIYHLAATVRFDEALGDAVLMNTRGTRELMSLAEKMKNLEVLVHVSTAYCNTGQNEIHEILYPPHADWEKTINAAEKVNPCVLNALTLKHIDPLPNTYTFAKSLAEHVVSDMSRGKIPAVIFRPSIVISSLNEPVKGWIDNFNGPIGLWMGIGHGILRNVYADPLINRDYIYVDVAIKSMIVATWKKGVLSDPDKKNNVSIYNCSNNGINVLEGPEINDLKLKLFNDYPFNKVLWAPTMMVDQVLRIIKVNFSLVKVQRKIFIACQALEYFIVNEWTIHNEKLCSLIKDIKKQDIESWNFDFSMTNPTEYYINSVIGAKKYLLNEKIEDLPKARKNLQRMIWLNRAAKIAVGGTLLYVISTQRILSALVFLENYLKNYV